MSARRDLSCAFEIDGRLTQTDVSGTLVVRFERSVPLEDSLAWMPAFWTVPALIKSVFDGKGALTARLVKSSKVEMRLPGGSMIVGASQEGKLLEYRGGRWTTGWKPATEFTAGHDSESRSAYFRRSAKGLEIVLQNTARVAESDVNFRLLGIEVDRVKYGRYVSAYVFSPLAALMGILVAGLSIGIWVVIIIFLIRVL